MCGGFARWFLFSSECVVGLWAELLLLVVVQSKRLLLKFGGGEAKSWTSLGVWREL